MHDQFSRRPFALPDSPRGASQYFGGAINLICKATQGLGQDLDLIVCFLPIAQLDGLSYSRKGFDSISRVGPRGVNLMPEPRSSRQPLALGQGSLGLNEDFVQRLLCLDLQV